MSKILNILFINLDTITFITSASLLAKNSINQQKFKVNELCDDVKSYFEKIPTELEEAAYVDGASRIDILTKIIAPLSTPGIVVTAIYAFIQAYAQQFLFAITFNSIREYMPIVSGLTEFIGYQSVKWNEMMAASIVGVFPVLIVFVLSLIHI